MPEKDFGLWEQVARAVSFAFVGAAIGLGQLMVSAAETYTRRIAIGRALTTGGLSMSAGIVLVWVPDLSFIGQIGVAATLASLGTSGLERIFLRVIQGRAG